MTETQLKAAAWVWWLTGAVVGLVVIIAGRSTSVLGLLGPLTNAPVVVVYGYYFARKTRAAYLAGWHDEAHAD